MDHKHLSPHASIICRNLTNLPTMRCMSLCALSKPYESCKVASPRDPYQNLMIPEVGVRVWAFRRRAKPREILMCMYCSLDATRITPIIGGRVGLSGST